MTGKYNNKNEASFFVTILKIALFIALSFGAIKIGMLGGNKLSTMDTNLVEHIDVDTFKMTLNNSLPIINLIYNSGNMSISFSGEIKNLLKGIFNFDLSSPLTILNAQSSILYSYYNKNYKDSLVARNDAEYKLDYSNREFESRSGDIDRGESSSIATEEGSEETKVVEPNKSPANEIALSNETKFKISENDIDELLKAPLRLKPEKKGPEVLIIHTHTTESYLSSLNDLNKKGVENRTKDPRYNVVRVGEELAQQLRKKYNIEVIHNGMIHDEDYNSSYGKSLVTVDKILKSYPSIRMVIDLHRDAIKNSKLRTAIKIEGKSAARVMFVVGSNQTLDHPNWRENFKLAIKLQSSLNQNYPGLTRPIDISYNRYNHHLSNGAIIIEVGGDGDTLEEAIETTKYLANVISEVIK